MRLRIVCAAALICAAIPTQAQLGMPGMACVPASNAVYMVPIPSNPIVEAYRLCQSREFAESSVTACAEVDRKYAETGIAAREQAEREKAANEYAACALVYIRNVAGLD